VLKALEKPLEENSGHNTHEDADAADTEKIVSSLVHEAEEYSESTAIPHTEL
jgi:hypothetical protein